MLAVRMRSEKSGPRIPDQAEVVAESKKEKRTGKSTLSPVLFSFLFDDPNKAGLLQG
jgi:hypothetical protein